MTEKHIADGILLQIGAVSLPHILTVPIRDRWDIDEEDDTVEELLTKAAAIADAGVFIKVSKVATTGNDRVVLESGHTLSGTLPAQKLHTPGMTAAGYVATCGRALFQAREEFTSDPFAAAIWDDICIAYLRLAIDALHTYVGQHIYPSADSKKMFAALNPGSLNSWPIRAQKELFAFLGEGVNILGVELTDSMLMLPTKSGSGLFFPTDTPYENCMHCPRITCPNRRAPYEGHE